MNSNNMICPNCRTGEESYKLDSRSPFCPYIQLYKSGACAKYDPIDKIEATGGGQYETKSSR